MSDTVCIAATCVDTVSQRSFAILCSDGRIEIEGIASGEIGHKALGIAPGMAAMFADSLPKSKELTDRYSHFLNQPHIERRQDNILELLREPLEAQHRADATAYLSAKYGMDYAEWLELEDGAQQNLMANLDYWRDRSQLLIVWSGVHIIPFIRMFQVTDRVQEVGRFAAIGSGASVASTSLYSRNYQTQHPLAEAIYYVYEAKRASEPVPGVGKETYLSILEFHPGIGKNIEYRLNSLELEKLSKQYAQFGPRPFALPSQDAILDLKFIPGMN